MDELCGVKGPDLKRAENEAIPEHAMRVTEGVISRWKSALATSEDPRRQAIGLALQNARPGPFKDKPKDTPVNNSLVLLAIHSNDPVIYALAIGQCVGVGLDMTPGPCQGLSWEHWAKIDPDNAVPWLWLAAKADRSTDEQGAEDALARASMASRFDGYSSVVSEIALNALPRDAAPLDKAVAGINVIMTSGIGVPAGEIATTLCSDTAVQQSTRKQQCTSIANTLADRGSTLIELSAASHLSRRLGFPADRQALLQKESQDAKAFLSLNPWRYSFDEGPGVHFVGDLRCDTVLSYNSFIDALEAAGGRERAALAAMVRTFNRSSERDR
jgi:hypothetical protein